MFESCHHYHVLIKGGGSGGLGDMSVRGTSPLKFRGGRKIVEENKEKERKNKKNSKIVNTQQTNGPKLVFERVTPLTPFYRPRPSQKFRVSAATGSY